MHIDHIAIWTQDLERLKTFYETYFGAQAGPKYTNPRNGYQSYFLTFTNGSRLELMVRPDIPLSLNDIQSQFTGFIHISLAVGSMEMVDELTQRLAAAGYPIMDGPRRTGDGYYESQVLDPDGNRLEITV
jgi:lactoylglutathione lyase